MTTYLYIYEFNNSLDLKIAPYFSNYRMEKINKGTINKLIKENIQIETLLNIIFTKHLGKEITKLDFTLLENGRPVSKDIYFSISHSNKYLVIAINKTNDIAVDIEHINSSRLKVKDKIYYDSKNITIDQLISDWTKKEAFIKLNGMTILSPLRDILISDDFLSFNKLKSYYQTFKHNDYYVTVTSNQTIDLNILNVDLNDF